MRTALWKIRQLCDGVVSPRGTYLSLAPAAQVDLSTLLSQARQLIAGDDPIDAVDMFDAFDSVADPVGFDGSIMIADTLSGDLLPDWDEDWIQFERERLRQLQVHTLEALARRLSTAGRHAEAVDAGQAAIAAEPLRESAQRTLILVHLAEGNPFEARRQYCLYRDLLWESLRIPPTDEFAHSCPERDRAARTRHGVRGAYAALTLRRFGVAHAAHRGTALPPNQCDSSHSDRRHVETHAWARAVSTPDGR